MRYDEFKKTREQNEVDRRAIMQLLEPIQKAGGVLHLAIHRVYVVQRRKPKDYDLAVQIAWYEYEPSLQLGEMRTPSLEGEPFFASLNTYDLGRLDPQVLLCIADVRKTFDSWKAGDIDELPPSGPWKGVDL